jgi:hypothetical protein
MDPESRPPVTIPSPGVRAADPSLVKEQPVLNTSLNAGDRAPCRRPTGAPDHRELVVLVLLPPGSSHHRSALNNQLTAALPTGVPTQPCHNHFLPQHDLHPHEQRLLVDVTGPSCAGGPIGLLDLTATQAPARALAQLLHHRWALAVAGTPPALPWRHYLRHHHGDPSAYPLDRATAEFTAQPRITAMIEHSRDGDPVSEFRLDEYDAGLIAHQTGTFGDYLCGIALFGDALSTPHAGVLSPHRHDEDGRAGFHTTAHTVLHTADPGSVVVTCHLYL